MAGEGTRHARVLATAILSTILHAGQAAREGVTFFPSSGAPILPPAPPRPEKAQVAADDYQRALDNVRTVVAQVAGQAGVLDRLRNAIPRDVDTALLQLLDAQDRYAFAAGHYVGTARAHRRLDDKLGRTRRTCAKQLQEEAGGPTKLSDTAADKAAGSHPDYVALRDQLVELADAKDDAESGRDVAKAGVETCQGVLEAITQLDRARSTESHLKALQAISQVVRGLSAMNHTPRSSTFAGEPDHTAADMGADMAAAPA